jgi:DNA-binding MarR family transcriptional regulator
MLTKSEITYFKFLRLSNKVESQVKSALNECGLTHSQLNILYILNEAHPKAMNVKDLKERMVVNQPDMTRLIDRLVNKGHVNREICVENRRKVDLRLTELGQTVFGQGHEAGKRVTGDFFEDFLTEEESVSLFKLLDKIRL